MLTPVMCLALAIHYEAGNQPTEGQIAVAEVVMNRVDSPRYPDTVCGVVNQDTGPKPHDCQFSFMCDGKPEDTDPDTIGYAIELADELLTSDVLFLGHGATHYHATYVTPYWSEHLTMLGKVGDHIFYVED